MARLSSIFVLSFALLLDACTGASSETGADQPVRVQGAQLRAGALPGAPPSDGGVDVGPTITSLTADYRTFVIGQPGKFVQGRTSADAVAVAVRFLDVGDAYWVFPVGAPNLAFDGEYDWTAYVDFAHDLTPGYHQLAFVAVDAEGNGGVQRTVTVCALPDVPSDVNYCNQPPQSFVAPAAAFTLSWNTDVDLDLVVVTPSGKVVTAKTPSTAGGDGGPPVGDPSTAHLTRDSNGQCRIDSFRRESLIFGEAPAPGTYRVYVRFFSACNRLSVAYESEIYRTVPAEGGGTTLAVTDRARGQLLSTQATGDVSLGTFVTAVTFP